MSPVAESDSQIESIPALGGRSRRFWRLAFSFPAMLSALLVVLAVITARPRLNDPDLWWHLKTGEIIWNTHQIPRTDLFSFTTNNHEWIAHEWLSQVAIYVSWRLGGYAGLMLWLCAFSSMLLLAAYALSSIYSGNAKVALLGALITWFFGTIGLAIRPHILGYLLLTCELLIVCLARTRNARWFLALPPLFVLWVNCHGSFPLGLIVLAVFLFCSFLDLRTEWLVSCRWRASERALLAVALALSVAALFVNPLGLKQVLYPLNLMFKQSTNLNSIDEWQPLTFNNARALALLAVTGLVCVSMLMRRIQIRLEELLLLGLGLGLALLHVRMLFLFGVLAAPIVCRLLSDAWPGYDSARDRIAANAVMMLISLGSIPLAFPTSKQLDQQVQEGNPVKAVEFIRRSKLSGPMLNEYVYGGYLMWALPEHKVFVDGRADIYDWTGVLKEFGAWATLETDPKALLDKYHIDFCLLSRHAPMSRVLPYMPGWSQIYSDKVSVVFAKVKSS